MKLQARFHRRHLLRLGALGGSAALLAACSGDDDGVDPTPASSATSPAGVTPVASPAPNAELRSRNGVLEATLILEPAMVPSGSATRWALTVNGTTPGPTLHVKPGDSMRLKLENRTAHSTNLHTHGLRVSPSGNADNPFIEIPAGRSFDYQIDIPADHPGGVFWYHPHWHHHVAEQLFAGFFGAIIVEDEFDALPEVATATNRVLLLHDTTVGSSEGAVMGVSMFDMMMGREGAETLVNGERMPEISARGGTLERWRIVNASSSRFYQLQIERHTFQVVGVDGGRLSSPIAAESVSLAPGERVEVFVQPASEGSYRLRTAAVDRGAPAMGPGAIRNSAGFSGAADLLTMKVSGSAPAAALPALAAPADGGAIAATTGTREVVFSMQGMNFFIDGKAFDPGRIDVRVAAGAVEEWTVRNTSTMDHPFHLHIWPFQVMAQSKGTPPPGWKDVVNVPAGGWVRLRIPFTGLTGKTVYHCHILDHEDMGMMAVIEVA